jgi:glycine dehydrogenase
MLKSLNPPVSSMDEFVAQVLPADILSNKTLKIGGILGSSDAANDEGYSESQLLAKLRAISLQNRVMRSYIGTGYAGTKVPEVIKRNVLQNPAWYTSYTPYQPEISQGRLESLLNFQTMVSDLTGLAIANASVLDEPTAAAEAMTVAFGSASTPKQRRPRKVFFVSDKCHPQTIAVLHGRAEGFGIDIVVGDPLAQSCQQVRQVGDDLIGVLVQYPDTEGRVVAFEGLSDVTHNHGALFCVATDLLALTVLKPPGEFGADVAFGNSQRFGVPFGYGGPHAAFFATSEKYKRKMPGRLIGLSKDRLGDPAVRLALQTREQHIRREKATSNICTAQALLANMSAMYAVYHGPEGLRSIAKRTITMARVVQKALINLGYRTGKRGDSLGENRLVQFDTVIVQVNDAQALIDAAVEKGINFRHLDAEHIGITLDETVEREDIVDVISVFAGNNKSTMDLDSFAEELGFESQGVEAQFNRTSPFLTHAVFNTHHSETELLRYIHHLESKDLSLAHSMIPLGSCTMKLNATTEMVPVTWPEFSSIHPFVPMDQAKGYHMLIKDLERDLAEITGFDAVSLQPNSGAQGEFAGLRVIREFQKLKPGKKRDICLIPVSAHGTNPASAAMAGMRVVPIKCEPLTGNLDLADLQAKCAKHESELAAIMITYPSTYGIFEPEIRRVCEVVHAHGGQVYMDGANMNAQIGLCSPGDIGADVCHLNLHKTFCIPHGGGGPGVGPIGVKAHLAPFLPGHPLVAATDGRGRATSPVSGAPWGSASILPISWAYVKLMGGAGLGRATRATLLAANYLMSRLAPHYPILYANGRGRCAHEFVLDVRPLRESAGVEAIDVAKRLQDYGFHAPTMSWPVAGTLMVEPTESESLEELDRFCDALVGIRAEVRDVEEGRQPREGNVLKMAPHTVKDLVGEEWGRPYSREKAAYPLPFLREKKFWPTVTRLDDGTLTSNSVRLLTVVAYGDLNLFCTCAPMQSDEGQGST